MVRTSARCFFVRDVFVGDGTVSLSKRIMISNSFLLSFWFLPHICTYEDKQTRTAYMCTNTPFIFSFKWWYTMMAGPPLVFGRENTEYTMGRDVLLYRSCVP